MMWNQIKHKKVIGNKMGGYIILDKVVREGVNHMFPLSSDHLILSLIP